MGVHNLPYIIGELTKAGRSPETPIALIRWGTTPQQQQLIGTFTTIMDQIEATGFEAPASLLSGQWWTFTISCKRDNLCYRGQSPLPPFLSDSVAMRQFKNP